MFYFIYTRRVCGCQVGVLKYLWGFLYNCVGFWKVLVWGLGIGALSTIPLWGVLVKLEKVKLSQRNQVVLREEGVWFWKGKVFCVRVLQDSVQSWAVIREIWNKKQPQVEKRWAADKKDRLCSFGWIIIRKNLSERQTRGAPWFTKTVVYFLGLQVERKKTNIYAYTTLFTKPKSKLRQARLYC